jgi:hypothetical protein
MLTNENLVFIENVGYDLGQINLHILRRLLFVMENSEHLLTYFRF